MENSRFNFGGVRFHGATMWTDFSLFGNPIQYGMICQDKMNDYRKIRRDPSYSKLRTIDTYKIHQISKLWLQESLAESTGYHNIVITHHAPSIKSVPDVYKTDPATSAYASNLEEKYININHSIGYMVTYIHLQIQPRRDRNHLQSARLYQRKIQWL